MRYSAYFSKTDSIIIRDCAGIFLFELCNWNIVCVSIDHQRGIAHYPIVTSRTGESKRWLKQRTRRNVRSHYIGISVRKSIAKLSFDVKFASSFCIAVFQLYIQSYASRKTCAGLQAASAGLFLSPLKACSFLLDLAQR